MSTLSPVDWLTLGVAVLSVLWGIWRGLVHEVLTLVGWVLAFWLAQRHSAALAVLLPWPAADTLRLALAFVLVFVGTAMAVALGIWLLGRLMSAVGLRPIDRLLGGGFGLLRAAVLLLALGMLVKALAWQDGAWWAGSWSGPRIMAVLQWLRPLMPEPWASYF